jgi:hypothetical protein
LATKTTLPGVCLHYWQAPFTWTEPVAGATSNQHPAHKVMWDHNRPACPGPKGPTLNLLSTPATHNRSPEDVHHCQVARCAHPPVKSSNPPAAAAGPSSLVSYTIKP